MLHMPVLETPRLLIRPFEARDLPAAHQLLDVDLDEAEMGAEKLTSLAERAEWLQWASLNPRQLALLNQPPYGDRAVLLKSSGQLIGACGLVPALNPFEQIPGFYAHRPLRQPGRCTPEVALFYAISPAHQRQGYALEAARALVNFAFEQLRLERIIAETDDDNAASLGVMRRLGMRILGNPLPQPAWLRKVGVLENEN